LKASRILSRNWHFKKYFGQGRRLKRLSAQPSLKNPGQIKSKSRDSPGSGNDKRISITTKVSWAFCRLFRPMNSVEKPNFCLFLWNESTLTSRNINQPNPQEEEMSTLHRFIEMVKPSLVENFKTEKFDFIKQNTAKYYHQDGQDAFVCLKFENEAHLLKITKLLEIGCIVDPIYEGLMFVSSSGYLWDLVVKESGINPANIIVYIFYEIERALVGQLIHMPKEREP
jgi:hypothetical protein